MDQQADVHLSGPPHIPLKITLKNGDKAKYLRSLYLEDGAHAYNLTLDTPLKVGEHQTVTITVE